MNKELYKEGLVELIKENINFEQYDNLLEEENLYIVPSSDIDKNLGSKFYSLLNFINFDNLNEIYRDKLNSKTNVDEEVKNIVKSTYKEVLKKGNAEYIMYDPAIPEHRVLNGSIVLEMVIGKSNCNYNVDMYINLIKKQKEYISQINEKIEKEIESIFGVPCTIFFDKRL